MLERKQVVAAANAVLEGANVPLDFEDMFLLGTEIKRDGDEGRESAEFAIGLDQCRPETTLHVVADDVREGGLCLSHVALGEVRDGAKMELRPYRLEERFLIDEEDINGNDNVAMCPEKVARDGFNETGNQ